jgi:hypothetical protein
MRVVQGVAVGAERLAVQAHLEELQLLAVEHQRSRPVARRRVALHREARPDLGALRVEPEVQLDRLDQMVGRPIVAEVHRLRGLGARLGHHWVLPLAAKRAALCPFPAARTRQPFSRQAPLGEPAFHAQAGVARCLPDTGGADRNRRRS